MDHFSRASVIDKNCGGNTLQRIFEDEPESESCAVCSGEVSNGEKYCADCAYDMSKE